MEKVVKMESSARLNMVILHSGLFVIGMLLSGNKLLNPRLFTMFDEPMIDQKTLNPVINPQTGHPRTVKKMQMEPLPGLPEFLRIKDEATYPIPTASTAIHHLYEKVTTPPPDVINTDIPITLN